MVKVVAVVVLLPEAKELAVVVGSALVLLRTVFVSIKMAGDEDGAAFEVVIAAPELAFDEVSDLPPLQLPVETMLCQLPLMSP